MADQRDQLDAYELDHFGQTPVDGLDVTLFAPATMRVGRDYLDDLMRADLERDRMRREWLAGWHQGAVTWPKRWGRAAAMHAALAEHVASPGRGGTPPPPPHP